MELNTQQICRCQYFALSIKFGYIYKLIGLNCELDTNACSNEPCSLRRNCTDLTPEEETRLGRGYNCSGCPKGYNDMNNKCEGNKEFKYDFQLKD